MAITIDRVSYNQMDVDYGTWTPSLKFGYPGTEAAVGMTYDRQSGIYAKQGRVVNVWGGLRLTALGSSTGLAGIHDLPFFALTFGDNLAQEAGVISYFEAMTGLPGSGSPLGLLAGGTALYVYINSSVESGNLHHTYFTDTSELRFHATYLAAS